MAIVNEVVEKEKGMLRRGGPAQIVELATDAAVPDVAADLDAQAAEKFGVLYEFSRELFAVSFLQVAADLIALVVAQFGSAFHDGVTP